MSELDNGSPETTGAMIAKLIEIRDRRREIKAEDSELVEQWEALKARALAKMEEEGSNRVSSKDGMIILSETVVPQVEDWDAVNAHILATGDVHLLQRRVATGAYRELIEAGQGVPGIVPFTKKDINVRSS